MAFKIPKATSADDIAVWLTGAKQQLDDYFAQLPASYYDEFFSYLPAAEQAVEAQAMKNAERTNYLQDIERQAKRFGYKPEVRRVEETISGGDIDTSFVPENAPTQGRSANVPQDTPQPQRGFNSETLLPEGVKLDVAMAIAKQNAVKKFPNDTKQQNKQFFKEMEGQGIVRDVAAGQWVDKRIVGEWVNIGGKKGRTVDKSKLDAMRASYEQSALEQTPQLSFPTSSPMISSTAIPTSDSSWWQGQSKPPGIKQYSSLDEVPRVPIDSSPFQVEAVYDMDLPDNLYQQIIRERQHPRGNYIQVLDTDGHVGWLPKSNSSLLPSNTEAEAILNDLDNLILNPQPQPIPQELPGTTASIPTNVGAIAPEAASVLSTQPGMPVTPQPELVVSVPQYEGNSSVATAPPSGVNNAVYPGSKAVGTSSDLPGGGNYDFEGEEFNRSVPQDNSRYYNVNYPQGNTPGQEAIPGIEDFLRVNYGPAAGNFNKDFGASTGVYSQGQTPGQPRIPGLLEQVYDTGDRWKNAAQGMWAGFVNNIEGGRPGRAQSVFPRVAQVINDQDFQARTVEGKVGQGIGEGTADWMGSGTRQNLWNAFPPDFVATHGAKWLGKDASRIAQVVIPFAAVTGLELGSQTYNPFNLSQGGRVAGYAAINPDDEDPRISTTPLSELLIDRGFLGKRGRLLPWEQFRQERTDIPYEQYEKYQNYLRNKDENFLRDVTGGLVKGTLDGINGPELSVMGYSVTPTGALAAGAALLAGKELIRTGRIAGFRKQ